MRSLIAQLKKFLFLLPFTQLYIAAHAYGQAWKTANPPITVNYGCDAYITAGPEIRSKCCSLRKVDAVLY